ncbi:MAG: hypothetical protein JXA90_06270, partial [Planctomycetes bacterium]|nr:hypothetical protein [Planctomycetota bacterium]
MSDDHRLTPQRPLLSPARWVLLAVAGGAGIYLATWIGPLSFYFSFQKKVLADGARDVNRPVVWHIPREVAYRETRGWSYARAEDGSGFPVPPCGQGDAAPRVESDGGLHLVHLEEATLRCQRFPRGFLVYLFLKELEHLGGRDDRRLSDSLILHELLGEVPGRYEFTWSARDRSTYAARILSKMLLFESRPATRLEASTRLDPLRTAVLVEFD